VGRTLTSATRPAWPPGRVSDPAEQQAQFLPQRRKRVAGQQRRGGVQFQVEPVQLNGDAGIADSAADRLVTQQRPGHLIDQEQFQLGAKGDRAHPKAGPLQQPPERGQALGESPLEADVVSLIEALLVDI
jgi:hypothetical protein